MGRPRLHDETTRLLLLDAAERLIDEEGPDAASVRRVAEEVGTSTRSVYSVFGSKAGLLEALAARLFDLLVAAIDGCPPTDDPLNDVVEASVSAFRRTALDHPALYSLVFLRVVPELHLGERFNQTANRAFARLEEMMERLQREGLLGTVTTRNAAMAVHALTEGLATIELRGALRETNPEPLWRSSVTSLVIGFSHSSKENRPPTT